MVHSSIVLLAARTEDAFRPPAQHRPTPHEEHCVLSQPPPMDWYPRARHVSGEGGDGGGGRGARPGGKGGGGGTSIANTEMRTEKSDLPVPLVPPVQELVQPAAAETDVPPTTRPESGEPQFPSFPSLK